MCEDDGMRLDSETGCRFNVPSYLPLTHQRPENPRQIKQLKLFLDVLAHHRFIIGSYL
jgi:hypothetical protein